MQGARSIVRVDRTACFFAPHSTTILSWAAERCAARRYRNRVRSRLFAACLFVRGCCPGCCAWTDGWRVHGLRVRGHRQISVSHFIKFAQSRASPSATARGVCVYVCVLFVHLELLAIWASDSSWCANYLCEFLKICCPILHRAVVNMYLRARAEIGWS